MVSVTVPAGEKLPALGLGTWKMSDRAKQDAELAALKPGEVSQFRVNTLGGRS
jgi:diketogulonate reductase-like aldo/keto reductase